MTGRNVVMQSIRRKLSAKRSTRENQPCPGPGCENYLLRSTQVTCSAKCSGALKRARKTETAP